MEKQKEVYGIIYVIRNKVNNKLYIGQTTQKRGFKARYNKGHGDTNIERVYDYHKYWKDRGEKYNSHLLNSIEKYGFDSFEVIEEFDVGYSEEELNKLEYMYIEIYQCRNQDYGYNDRYGGNNGKLSERQRKILSESKKGEKNPFYGKHLSQEHREKLSKAHKGKKHSEEAKKNMSEGRKGIVFTEEHRRHLSEAHMGEKNRNTKIVYCEELNRWWYGGRPCAEELNLVYSSLIGACRNNKKHKGYTFRYITKEELEEIKNRK